MLTSKLVSLTVPVLLLFIAASSSGKSSLEWAQTAEHTIKQLGFAFGGANAALGSYNATKAGHLFATLTKKTARLAGFFGTFGAIISAVLAFIPGGDSAELAFMKKEFAKLSQQIDTIARSLDETKNLIKLETQKSTYIQYEHNIHYGYSQMETFLNKVEEVACSDLKECKRKKILLAEGYIKDMDVRQSMDAIYRGVTSDSTFGRAMLSLLKEDSNCNIPKIDLFTNKVTALITKGMTVSIFHDLITKHDYDYMDDAVLSEEIFKTLEKKRQGIQDSCLNNFDYWMTRDVQNGHTLFTSDLKASNKNILSHLKRKFPWVIWHALTYYGEKEPVAGPRNSPRRELFTSSKTLNINSIVMPALDADVEESGDKTFRLKEILRKHGIGLGDIDKLENLINGDVELKGQVQSFAILQAGKLISGYYRDDLKQQTVDSQYGNVSPFNVVVDKPSRDIFVAASFNTVDYPPKCTGDFCSNKGDCFVYPYSTELGCKCHAGFSGEKCETKEENLKLKRDVNFLLDNAMKLPTFASIQHAIEDTQLYLKTSSENIQESIMKLGAKIDVQFKGMGEFMSRKFDWFEVLMKYKESIENLYYFQSISEEKIYTFDPSQANMSHIKSTVDEGVFSMLAEKDIAKYMLSPVGIQKWLYHINFLVVGRNDNELNAHKPLIFMVIDKYKDGICFQDYKEKISRAYSQLMLLQLQGYVLWINAYSSDGRDSSVIANRYSQVLKKQMGFLDRTTCNVQIPNSKLLQDCTGGYFIYNTMDISVSCKDNYYLTGKLSPWMYVYWVL